MSTRAIIGALKPDDTVLGVWQWNDGEGLLPLLMENFKTINDIAPLIKLGVINLICDDEGFRDLAKWQIDCKMESQGIWHHFGNAHAYQCNDYRGSKPTLYRNVDEAAGQDINCLYLFDMKTFSWSVVK